MHTFLGLPNEILLNVVENLQLEDIESITSSCKDMRKLASKILSQHLSRKRRFTTVAVGRVMNSTWDGDAQIRGVHPIFALRDFILDEESALYPRTLIVGCLDEPTDFLDDDPEEGQIADSDLVDTVAQLGHRLLSKVSEVTQVLRLDADHWFHSWTSTIVSGNLEAAACILIALLPNIQTLRIVDDWVSNGFTAFRWMLDRLLSSATFSERDLAGLNSFKRLSEVGYSGCSAYNSTYFDISQNLSTLPSICTVKGRYIDGDLGNSAETYRHGLHSEPGGSNITTLEFHCSSIDVGSFDCCIQRIKSLQKFTYDFCDETAMRCQPWEPRGIVRVLQTFANMSLVHLELTGVADFCSVRFERGEPFIGSLRAFEVLETLRLETMMLYREVKGTEDGTLDAHEVTENDPEGSNVLVEPERLVDILPASAKRLRLVGGLSNEEAAAMLAGLVELKDKRVPNLRRIFFEDLDPSSQISGVCEEASVRARFCGRV